MEQNESVKKITKAALIKRINRKLAHDGSRLSVTRDKSCVQGVCKYYVVDRNNHVDGGGDDLMELAREKGCIDEHEILAER
jgi:hypothetical protein